MSRRILLASALGTASLTAALAAFAIAPVDEASRAVTQALPSQARTAHDTPDVSDVQTAAGTAPSEAGLMVSPRRALFDAHLWPGESEYAAAHLTNTTAETLTVDLTAELAGWDGHDQALNALQLTSKRTETCTAEAMTGTSAITMSAVNGLDHGTIAPGETVPLCLKVELPTTATLPSVATTTVHLTFNTFEHAPTTGTVPKHLAFTGAALHFVGFLAAAVTLAGVALTTLRRRRPTPDPL